MSDEKSARALVNAARAKEGLSGISRAVKLLVEARRGGKPAEAGGVELKTDKDAYRVQDSVFSKLWPGVTPAAWKAGGPSPDVEPTAAPIAPDLVMRSPARIRPMTGFLGVEAEVAFRLARGLPPRTKPYTDDEVAAAIGEVLVTIEICATRLAKWETVSGLMKLADFQGSGGLVAGGGTSNWQAIDFAKQEMEITIGDRVARASGSHSFGNPFRLMPWIAKHCAKRGAGLRAGDIVTTGSWTGLEPAQEGDEVVARFRGIGEARLKIE